jgi:hypothetical protein
LPQLLPTGTTKQPRLFLTSYPQQLNRYLRFVALGSVQKVAVYRYIIMTALFQQFTFLQSIGLSFYAIFYLSEAIAVLIL